MEPLDFLRLVLPSPGHGRYCAFNAQGVSKWNDFFDTVEELEPHFDRMVQRGFDTYFGLATFELPPETEKGKGREAENARFMRSFFLDLDGYESPEVAWATLRAFLKATGLWSLGSPYLVKSGGGLHAYWPLTRDIPVDEWLPIARNFKRLCAQEKLKIDTSVPADSARVLRCPGTVNFKKNKDGTWKYGEPQPVVFVKEGSSLIDPQAFGNAIADKLITDDTPSLELPGARPAGSSGIELELARQQKRYFRILEEKTAEGRGCAQLAFYHANAAEKVEPIWRGLLTVAKFCEDGWEHAVKLSAEHPYDESELTAKWDAVGTGPHRCVTFNDVNPGVCAKCQHWNGGSPKIGSPIVLGTQVAVNTEAAEIIIEAPARESDVEPAQIKVYRPEPPRGFFYGDHGGVYGTIKFKEGKKTVEQTVLVLPYMLYVTDLLNDRGTHGAQFVAEHPLGRIVFELRGKEISAKEKCIEALMGHRITAENHDYAATLWKYVYACYNDACRERKAVSVATHYGWQEDGSFVFAGHVFRKDKEPVPVATHGLENIISATKPRGSLQEWQRYMRMIIGKRLYKQLAVFLAGTAAPLMRYTSLAGMTVHACSRKSGTGKTLSLSMVASVWGHPIDYRVGQGTSAVTMQHRLGDLHSLPLAVDEITEQTRKTAEWFANFLLSMTDGKGKERMYSVENKERENLTAWRSVAVMTSNTRALDFLTLGRKHSSDGELYRLIEIKMPDQIMWTEDERRMRTVLENNHGVAGWHLAQWMVANEHLLRGWVEEGMQYARDYFKMTDHERYWEALLGAAIAMGRCLSEAGILKLPLTAIIEAFKHAIKEMREEIAASEVTADELWWEYVQNNYGQMIIIRHAADSKIVPIDLPFRNKEQELSSGRLQIMGRVDIDVTPGWTDFLIPNPLIRKHCADRNMGIEEFAEKLQLANDGMRIELNSRKDMLAGTKIGKVPGMSRPHCLRISCRNEEVKSGSMAVGEG